MADGVARSQDFFSGSERVRHPEFHTMQQVHGGYHPTSNLAQLLPSGNGMARVDLQRTLMGAKHSPLGQSSQSFDKHLWLNRDNPVPLYKKTFEEK